jgi:MscS family membrane protein
MALGGFSLALTTSPLHAAILNTAADSVLNYEVFQIKLWRLLISLAIIIAVLAINTILRQIFKKRREKADAAEEGTRRSLIGFVLDSALLPCRLMIWAIALRIIRPFLFEGGLHAAPVSRATEVLFSLAAAVFIYKLVDLVEYYLGRYAEGTDNKLDDMLVPVVRKSLRVLVTIIAGLHLYKTVSDSDISTLLAGLGIGGLAFALAAQDTLKNLFGCVMILADRPFMAGDRIITCGHDGVVEAVGFRSTRLRRLDDHVVSIPNSVAADAVIQNVAKRRSIKHVMNVTITYDTPLAKVEKAIDILKDILKDHEGMDEEFPARVYFNNLNADSLNILVIYWYFPAAYWDYLAFAQKVNLELLKRYEEEGIDFAFPTQTLHLAGDPNRELNVQIPGLADLPKS